MLESWLVLKDSLLSFTGDFCFCLWFNL